MRWAYIRETWDFGSTIEIEEKHTGRYVYLNDYTMYVVEDISGSNVDKYHYEINFLPEFGLKVTHNE